MSGSRLDVLLPLGLSFTVFQTLSVTIDTYRRTFEGAKKWSDFLLYISFFPHIIAGPIVRGSGGIKAQLDNLKNMGKKVPEYIFDPTSNTANCALQAINPALTGHAMDNYALRTGNIAKLFASKINADTDCTIGTKTAAEPLPELAVFPNPARDVLTVTWSSPAQVLTAALLDATGRAVFEKNDFAPGAVQFQMPLPAALPSGTYALRLTTNRGVVSQVVVRQ